MGDRARRAVPGLSSRCTISAETGDETPRHDGETIVLRTRLDAAELRIIDKDATIEDLRRRLDTATAQLGEALQQVRLLTDQRTVRRSWLPWRRG